MAQPVNLCEKLAGECYEAYCVAVGGRAFNGDVLPSWLIFRADPTKRKQSDAWLQVAIVAAEGVIRVLTGTDDPLFPRSTLHAPTL